MNMVIISRANQQPREAIGTFPGAITPNILAKARSLAIQVVMLTAETPANLGMSVGVPVFSQRVSMMFAEK